MESQSKELLDRAGRLAAPLGLLLALLLGAVLRLVWSTDMEYKLDEDWTYHQAQAMRTTGEFSWLGMPTSQEFRNPGMSVWIFALLGEWGSVDDPLGLARTVQVTNIAALVLLVGFIFVAVPRPQREAWLWATALVAVNPLAVLFQRKIWPPSVLPLLTVLFLIGWWYRQRSWGAALWGVVGACLGQIHMSGFFFAAGFVLWAGLFDRRHTAWGGWLIGSVLGALPLIPWVCYFVTTHEHRPITPLGWTHALEGKFWTRWILEPLGFGLSYALQKDTRAFLSGPVIGGCSTYLVLLLHLVLGAVGVLLLARGIGRRWQERRRWREWCVGRESSSAFTQNAALLGFGLVITLSCFPLHRHYMVILFVLPFLWLARLALGGAGGRVLLGILFVAQLMLTIQFLCFVHQQQTIHGDYGQVYCAQERSRVLSPRVFRAP